MSLPPSEIPLGAMRFNSDSQKLEYWIGSAWMQIQTFSPNLGNSTAGVRGTFAGGFSPSNSDRIDFITIPTQGDATDFGNLIAAKGAAGTCASNTRGLMGGGGGGGNVNTIQFWTFSSIGDAVDFGDLTSSRHWTQPASNKQEEYGLEVIPVVM